MIRVKASLTALALTVASGTAALVFAAPAQAATCYWYSGQFGTSSNCDNKDPDVLGSTCGSDARTVASVVLKRSYDGAATGPTVDLRYSNNCRTVWARIRGAWGVDYDQVGCTVTIHRNSDGQELYKSPSFGSTNATVWTNVLYDAGVTSYAKGHCDTGPGYSYDGRTINW
ncbi:DUF2690 domain-containing protein [Streptomyces sp. NPDC001982]|uniref:DUF2690 domain-containing protein n=1 Tax=Streptomyces sp. NPDC001982 TaxID=3154405 RepID=UPI00331EC07E